MEENLEIFGDQHERDWREKKQIHFPKNTSFNKNLIETGIRETKITLEYRNKKINSKDFVRGVSKRMGFEFEESDLPIGLSYVCAQNILCGGFVARLFAVLIGKCSI